MDPTDFSASLKITSPSNPKVRYLQNLKERKFREQEKRIFVEGYRELVRALESRNLYQNRGPEHFRLYPYPLFQPEILCISPDCFLGSNEWDLIWKFKKQHPRIAIWEFSRPVFEKISYRDRPDGLVAIANLPVTDFTSGILERLSQSQGPRGKNNHLILVIEGVEKPGNLGTILRTADGAGVSLVIVTDPRTDIFSPNVIRSSTGMVFQIPVALGETRKVLEDLGKYNFRRYALTPEASDVYWKADLTGNLALIFGSEQYGLTEDAKRFSEKNIQIPMLGEADSLNLAQSCGIVVYESLRQVQAV